MRVQQHLIIAIAAIAFSISDFSQVSPQLRAASKPARMTIEGVITKLEVTSPHVYFYVSVTVPGNDKPTTWSVQTASYSELTAKGIKKADLRVGTTVRIEGTLLPGDNRLEAPVSGISVP